MDEDPDTATSDGLLLLRAEDAGDLPTISACVQDMAVKAGEVGWWPRQRRLVVLGNRFRWERVRGGGAATRVQAALRFDHVERVERREWPEEAHAVLPLLAVTAEGEARVVLSFGGGAALRLTVEAVDAILEDVTGAWEATAVPDHGLPDPTDAGGD
jgi:hypothetical protein